MRILYDSKLTQFKTPFGTLTPGQACTLHMMLPVSICTVSVQMLLLSEAGQELRSVPFARAQSDALGLRIFELMAQKEMDREIRVVACGALPASQARKAAGQLAEGAKLALVLIPREEGWSFAMSSATEDVCPMTRALCAAFGGKGGGPKDMTQGVLSSGTEAEIRAKLEG